MTSEASGNDTWYSDTPSQAEGERDEAGEHTPPQERHRQVSRTQPSQAEGERGDDIQTVDRGKHP